jgi:hypothetical protein
MFVQVATASQFFISYTIRTFGALTFATIMTTRQVYIQLWLVSHTCTHIMEPFADSNSTYVFAVGEYTAVLCLVCASPQLDAVGWRCKSSVPFLVSHTCHFLRLFRLQSTLHAARPLYLEPFMRKVSPEANHRRQRSQAHRRRVLYQILPITVDQQ